MHWNWWENHRVPWKCMSVCSQMYGTCHSREIVVLCVRPVHPSVHVCICACPTELECWLLVAVLAVEDHGVWGENDFERKWKWSHRQKTLSNSICNVRLLCQIDISKVLRTFWPPKPVLVSMHIPLKHPGRLGWFCVHNFRLIKSYIVH